MSDELSIPRRKIYFWWVAPLVTTLVAIEGDHGHKAMVYEIDKSNKSLHYSFLRHFDLRWERFSNLF